MLSVCSLDRPDTQWPTHGGDIVATHLDRPCESSILFTTSSGEMKGIPAALAFGPDGCLYVTDEGRRAVLRVTPDGTQEAFIDRFAEAPLNGPNDLSFDPDGNLFFTDPWTSSPTNPVGAVYGYAWDSGRLHQIDSRMAFPNGIVVRDGRVYAAETYRGCVWVYEVEAPGSAQGKRLFCTLPQVATSAPHGPDGMAFDTEGNLYVAYYGGSSVVVYSSAGELVERIETAGMNPTNVCFGGREHRDLLVTIDDLGELHVHRLDVAGDRLSFCPSSSTSHPWRVAQEADALIQWPADDPIT